MNDDIIGTIDSLSGYAETTSNVSGLGKLRSRIEAVFNTYEAVSLFSGVKREEDDDNDNTSKSRKHTRHNLTMLSQSLMLLEGDIRKDNPWADGWFDVNFKLVDELRQSIKEKTEQLRGFIKDKVSSNIRASISESICPIKFNIRSSSVLYYQYLYAVLDIDTYIRLVKLARHLGLITEKVEKLYCREVLHACRSAISSAASYRHHPVTRDDVATNNAVAQAARELYERLKVSVSDDHISGVRRHEMAPEIYTKLYRQQVAPQTPYESSATEIEPVTDQVAVA